MKDGDLRSWEEATYSNIAVQNIVYFVALYYFLYSLITLQFWNKSMCVECSYISGNLLNSFDPFQCGSCYIGKRALRRIRWYCTSVYTCTRTRKMTRHVCTRAMQ